MPKKQPTKTIDQKAFDQFSDFMESINSSYQYDGHLLRLFHVYKSMINSSGDESFSIVLRKHLEGPNVVKTNVTLDISEATKQHIAIDIIKEIDKTYQHILTQYPEKIVRLLNIRSLTKLGN